MKIAKDLLALNSVISFLSKDITEATKLNKTSQNVKAFSVVDKSCSIYDDLVYIYETYYLNRLLFGNNIIIEKGDYDEKLYMITYK